MAAAIEVCPLHGALGAEIRGVDLSKPLDGATKDAILAAWHAHCALVIRNQTISDPQLIEFSRLFGELEMAPPNKSGSHWIEGYPELACISNITVNGQSIGSLGNGEAIWHTDMSFMEEPPAASLLYAIEILRNRAAPRISPTCTAPTRPCPTT